MSARLAVAAVLVLGCRAAVPTPTSTGAAPPPPVATPAVAPLAVAPPPVTAAHVAVVGASVSAGFASPRLAAAFAAAGAGAVTDAADLAMFVDPLARGRAQVAQVTAAAPTLVVALDFLFWFAYQVDQPAGRLASLERGLALLAPITAPLAVGELPDMRTAHPRLISPAAVPSPAELAAMNARLRAWAAARPDTVVIPLHAWIAPLAAGGEIELAPGEVVPARDLVFIDGLHANDLGLWYLLDRLDHLLTAELGVAPDALVFVRP
jgi:hypothetical protein